MNNGSTPTASQNAIRSISRQASANAWSPAPRSRPAMRSARPFSHEGPNPILHICRLVRFRLGCSTQRPGDIVRQCRVPPIAIANQHGSPPILARSIKKLSIVVPPVRPRPCLTVNTGARRVAAPANPSSLFVPLPAPLVLLLSRHTTAYFRKTSRRPPPANFPNFLRIRSTRSRVGHPEPHPLEVSLPPIPGRGFSPQVRPITPR